jgi:hypothetical protein
MGGLVHPVRKRSPRAICGTLRDEIRRVGEEIPGVDEPDRGADRVRIVVHRRLTFSLQLRQW